LGIYTTGNNNREKSDPYLDVRDYRPGTGYGGSTTSSIQGMANEPNDPEPATVLASPHVVNIRKGQATKKFNWKKGGQTVAKGVSKGFKGAFSSANPQQAQYDSQSQHHHPHIQHVQGSGQHIAGMSYGSMMPIESPASSLNGSRPATGADQTRGFFGQRLGKGMPGMPGKTPSNGNLTCSAAEGPASESFPFCFPTAVHVLSFN
jgi:hypothetical protein